MINTEQELRKLADALGLEIEITDKSVTFNDKEGNYTHKAVDSEIAKINHCHNYIMTMLTDYYIPDWCEESIVMSEETIEKLTSNGGTIVQCTITCPIMDLVSDFDCDTSVRLTDTINGDHWSYALTMYEFFTLLGMSKEDMKNEFDAAFDEDEENLYTINEYMVIDKVNNLTVADIQYVYIRCLLEKYSISELYKR